MKTFKEYVTKDITNPYNQYRDGSGLLGPGMVSMTLSQTSMQINMVIQKVNF